MKSSAFRLRGLAIFVLLAAAWLPWPLHAQVTDVPFTIDHFRDQEFYLKKALDNLTRGDGYYFDPENQYFKLALPFFEEANAFNPNNAELNFKLGVCYLNSNDKFKARTFFEKALTLNPSVNPRIHYYIGLGYHVNGEWDKAIESYERHAQLQLSAEDRRETEKRLDECRLGKILSVNPVAVRIELLSDEVNSKYPEYVPLITADESLLYFTSKREDTFGGGVDLKDAEYFEDIYYCEKTGDRWSKARNAGPPLNSRTHDAGAGLSADGHTMFIYKGDQSNGDLLVSYLVNGKWSKPEDLGRNINTKYHESSACLSPDGNTLFFVSDRPGGMGRRDIYTSQWDQVAKKWKPAQNLDSTINTPYDEEGVFMHPDGKTLYYSSKGPGNTGGYDVFYSVFEDGKWGTPVNIGYPINTPDDDVFFTVSASGKHAYYSSFKKEGKGEKDIYLVAFEEGKQPAAETAILKGTIVNDQTGEPVSARIELIDLGRSEHIGNFYSDASTGRFLISLPAGRKYGAVAYAEGFLFEAKQYDIPEKSAFHEIVSDIRMKPMNEGANMVLNSIVFETDKALLMPESITVLDQLVRLMKDNKTLRVEISGHTDNVGDEEYNLKLSENRALAVVDYLVGKGIDKKRLTAAGYGETKPIASNDTPEGRQKNRRIEFMVEGK